MSTLCTQWGLHTCLVGVDAGLLGVFGLHRDTPTPSLRLHSLIGPL